MTAWLFYNLQKFDIYNCWSVKNYEITNIFNIEMIVAGTYIS